MDLAVLERAGIDTEDALSRVMGSEALLMRLLNTFLEDDNMAKLEAAAAADDAEAGLEAAHALKGVTGTLSMTELYALTSRQCELIRADDWPAARALTPEVAEAYRRVVAGIGACGE
ncbi:MULTISPECIES: Hpt domain-containing protein [Collinsella]|uniref:Hpt domain-containing protein n=1 Tax=Collinsella TaxID=102106 RepID=UPI000B39BAA1|nr:MULTISPECIES: Hpt domain-containing protein [Collinsella]MDM8163634.1 Hpt domain-containing protein [Collinsella intestinalis]OUO63782.1 hypothetical protein B5F70_08650 [Collinsella sp. An268]